jgi:hypothetical protein
LFSALNKGGDITKGLKKVDKSQMTHKNPALRASSVVPSGYSYFKTNTNIIIIFIQNKEERINRAYNNY